MHKKFGFYIGLISFVIMGCQTESLDGALMSKLLCEKSGGVFHSNDNKCECGKRKCLLGECRTTDPTSNDLTCGECDSDESKCDDGILFECDENYSWKIKDNCQNKGCNKITKMCLDCNSGEHVCNGENIVICGSSKVVNYCDQGCDSETNLCRCDINNNEDCYCDINNNEDNEGNNICLNEKLYQCKNGKLDFIKDCSFGCSNTNKCKECENGDTKCIDKENEAIVWTCKDGFWPSDTDGTKFANKICNSEKTHAVDCLSNQCIPNSDWDKLECEHQKNIILAYINYIKQSEGLQRESLEQINQWFEIEIDVAKISIKDDPKNNKIDLCNSGKVEFNTDPEDNNQMISEYNDMYESEKGALDLEKCKAFVEKYMCNPKNSNHELSEFEGLFKFKPINSLGATIINCNSNNEWDINNITPCLSPEYTYVDTGSTGLPEYYVRFTHKGCADPLEGSKYSNACAINDKD